METRCRLMAGGGDPRESATESKPPRFIGARVKGWGKSPPRDWQQERHGKPHREQDRIGTVRGETLEGCFRLTVRVGCVRRMATCAQDEWPPRSRTARGEGHTEPGLQASWQFLHDIAVKSADISRLRLRARLLIQPLQKLNQPGLDVTGFVADRPVQAPRLSSEVSIACQSSSAGSQPTDSLT